MELNFTDQQLMDFVDVIIGYWCEAEINNRLYENHYLRDKCIDDLSSEEFKEAVQMLHDRMYDNIIDSDWGYWAMNAIDDVIAKRPNELRTPNMLDKTLAAYGLEIGRKFRWEGCIYWFDEMGDLHYGENLISSCNTLGKLLAEASIEDIEILPPCKEGLKPQPPDLLNDTLKSIGLKTMQYFKIADKEFETDDFYIDSFGDVYWVNGHPDDPDRETACDKQHEFLTLGRILTQYYDKIVPWDVKAIRLI